MIDELKSLDDSSSLMKFNALEEFSINNHWKEFEASSSYLHVRIRLRNKIASSCIIWQCLELLKYYVSFCWFQMSKRCYLRNHSTSFSSLASCSCFWQQSACTTKVREKIFHRDCDQLWIRSSFYVLVIEIKTCKNWPFVIGEGRVESNLISTNEIREVTVMDFDVGDSVSNT